MTTKFYCCALCNYMTKRRFDLKRHQNAVHKDLIIINKNKIEESKKEEIKKDFYCCNKCNKTYKTKKNYLEHQEKCIGIDNLTCPKCMHHFSSSGNKSKHIKNNNCESKSIIHYYNYNNILCIIRNFENERTDFITIYDFINLFKNNYDCFIENYIILKHYNNNFPENHNIKYDKNKGCLIKKYDKWILININEFIISLFNHNLNILHIYYKENLNNINNIITNDILKKIIHLKLYELDFNLNKKLFKKSKNNIKTIIINDLKK